MNKLKTLFITSLLFTTLIAVAPNLFAQYEGTFNGIYFFRSVSAQSAALGMTRSTMPDKAFTVHNNSSLIGFQEGVAASYSTSYNYYIADETDIQYIGISSRITDKFALGISHLRFNYGYNIGSRTNQVSSTDYNHSISTVALIYRLSDFISLGANTRRFSFSYISNSPYVLNEQSEQVYFDLTSSMDLPFELASALKSSLTIGLTWSNITSSSLKLKETPGRDNLLELPSVAVIGIQGHITLPGVESSAIADKLSFDVIVELQEVFNYDSLTRFSFGFQLGLNELIYLRLGGSQDKVADNGTGSPSYSINQITYGLGLNLPISKLLKIQKDINLTLDYVNLEQPQLTRNIYFDFERYQTLNISLATNF